MADVKIFVVTEGVADTLQQMGLLNSAAQQQANTGVKVENQFRAQTRAVKDFGTAVTRTSRALGVVGLAGQFLQVNNAAIAAANAINSAAAAAASPKLAKAAGIGGIIATVAAVTAGVGSWLHGKSITDPAQESLMNTTAAGVTRTESKLLDLAEAGKLTAEQFTQMRQELAAIVALQGEGKLDAIERSMSGQATAAEEAADRLKKVQDQMRGIDDKKFALADAAAKRSIEENQIAQERIELEGGVGVRVRERQLAILKDQEIAVMNQAQLWSDMFDAGRISKDEALERRLETLRQLNALAGAQRQVREQSPFGAFELQMLRMRDMANLAVSPFVGMFDGISTSIQGLINLTMTWGDALRNIGLNVVQSIIKSFSDMVSAWITSMAMMVVKWVWSHLIMKGVLTAFHFFARLLGWQTTQSQIAQEAAKAPVLATNAATSSVGSYGASAVIGMALAVLAIGAIIGFALGAFKEGGYTGNAGVNDVTGVVHGREFVMPADRVAEIGLPTLEAMRRGERVGGGGGGGRGGKLYLVDSRQDAVDRRLSSGDLDDEIMEVWGRNAHRVR